MDNIKDALEYQEVGKLIEQMHDNDPVYQRRQQIINKVLTDVESICSNPSDGKNMLQSFYSALDKGYFDRLFGKTVRSDDLRVRIHSDCGYTVLEIVKQLYGQLRIGSIIMNKETKNLLIGSTMTGNEAVLKPQFTLEMIDYMADNIDNGLTSQFLDTYGWNVFSNVYMNIEHIKALYRVLRLEKGYAPIMPYTGLESYMFVTGNASTDKINFFCEHIEKRKRKPIGGHDTMIKKYRYEGCSFPMLLNSRMSLEAIQFCTKKGYYVLHLYKNDDWTIQQLGKLNLKQLELFLNPIELSGIHVDERKKKIDILTGIPEELLPHLNDLVMKQLGQMDSEEFLSLPLEERIGILKKMSSVSNYTI